MASRLGGDDDDIIAEINVTPLVDVVLVLLIIFMVTATYIVAPSIKVELPKAASGEATQTSTLSVVLTRDAQLYLNGAPTNRAALIQAIQKERASHPDLQAIISADKEVSHGEVIQLIDLVKTNGVTKFAINIDPEVARGGLRPSSAAPSPPAPASGEP